MWRILLLVPAISYRAKDFLDAAARLGGAVIVGLNGKIFGLDNLYIGGSSVFPTVGHANPTFTIVQPAFRLADHSVTKS